MIKLLLTLILLTSSCKADYSAAIAFYAAKHGINQDIAYNLVKRESSFRPYVVSHKGAIGLTQVIYEFHEERCGLTSERQLFNPYINLNCGFKVLAHYKKLCGGNKLCALASYNAGFKNRKYGMKYAKEVLGI